MSNAGIHRDNQVQIGNQRRCVGETLQRIAEMQKIALILQHGYIVGANILLQTHKCCFDIQKWQQRAQAD